MNLKYAAGTQSIVACTNRYSPPHDLYMTLTVALCRTLKSCEVTGQDTDRVLTKLDQEDFCSY